MADKTFNVLCLCNGNSARGVIAERILNRLGCVRLDGYSAGSHLKGEKHSYALAELTRNNYQTSGLRGEDWSEFGAAQEVPN